MENPLGFSGMVYNNGAECEHMLVELPGVEMPPGLKKTGLLQ